MGSTNDPNRFPLPTNETQDYLIPYAFANAAIAVGVGDLCYYKGDSANSSINNMVAYPADQFTSLGSEALDQAAFASVFCGVSQQQVLSTETSLNKRFTLSVEGRVYEFKCPSQTFHRGDPVGVFSNGTTLDPQQVDKLAASGGGLGWVVKDYLTATTRVRVILEPSIAGNVGIGGNIIYNLGVVNTADNITNTSTKTAFNTTATIQAGTLRAGDILHVKAVAQVTAQNSTNTNLFTLDILTAANTYTSIYNTTALNIAASGLVLAEFELYFTAVGASGAFYAVGDSAAGNINSASRAVQALANTAINTNETITIRVTDTQSAASTGNNAQLLILNVTNERR